MIAIAHVIAATRMRWTLAVGAIACGIGLTAPTARAEAPPPTFGYLENILVGTDDLPMRAKLDTGADHSSMDADVVARFNRNGKDWIRFKITDAQNRTQTLERQLVRTAAIKRHGAPSQGRPVVAMEICLGTTRKRVEINLADRSHFTYRMLIGRSFLAGAAVVDSARKFTTDAKCDPLRERS